MPRLILGFVLALGVGLVLVAAMPVAVSTPKLGVVDLSRVFDAHPRKAELERELTALEKGLNEKLQTLQESLEKKRADLALYEPNTTPYRELEKAIFSLSQEVKFEKARAQDEFAERKRAFNENLANEVQRAVADFGAAQGFDIIWQRRFSLSSDALSWSSVVYTNDASDVTDEVIAALGK